MMIDTKIVNVFSRGGLSGVVTLETEPNKWFLRRLPDEFLDSDTFVFVEDISTENLIIMKTFIGSWVLE